MFDPLLEEDPWVMKVKERERLEGERRGVLEGELKSSRIILVKIVRKRFPSLAEVAEVRALQLDNPDLLVNLVEQVTVASGEQEARALLEGRTAA